MKRHQHHEWFTIVPAPAGTLARNDPLWITLILFGWLVGLSQCSHASDDWPVWRGPTRDGIAPAGQHPPIHWDEATHVLWKTKIPGRGNSSPIIVGDQIFLTTSSTRLLFQKQANSRLPVAAMVGDGMGIIPVDLRAEVPLADGRLPEPLARLAVD